MGHIDFDVTKEFYIYNRKSMDELIGELEKAIWVSIEYFGKLHIKNVEKSMNLRGVHTSNPLTHVEFNEIGLCSISFFSVVFSLM